jgi:hypothetical protein
MRKVMGVSRWRNCRTGLRKQNRLTDGALKTQIPPRDKRRAGRVPYGPAVGDQRGAIVRGKRFLALTAAAGTAAASATRTAAASATGSAAEDASATGSAAVNADCAGLSHGHTLSPNPA